MDPLSALLQLPAAEKAQRGLEHTPREIAQQPATWRKTFEQLRGREEEIREFLTAAGLSAAPEQRPTVFLIGAGTSDYIGQALHLLLRTQWQCEVIPVASTSLLPNFSAYVLKERRSLWISFSRSGESPEGVAVLERALAECPQIAHLLVTCNQDGRMHQALRGRANGYAVVLDEATNDRGLAMTSSFTNMVLAGQMLAHVGTDVGERAWTLERYEPILQSLAHAGERLLPRAAELAFALGEGDYKRACYVGSGVLAGAAMECALKLLELTAGRVQTFTQATLALRHGPMAALDGETLFVALVSSEAQRRGYELDLLREIGSKGLARTRVAVATDARGLEAAAELVLSPGEDAAIPDLCRPVLDVLFGQMLGLFFSLRRGLKPDVPSPQGVISRVVPRISLY
jgi:tagatose-6-phosphate ketose/aldose isomerase